MPIPDLPLSGFPSFRADTLDRLCESVEAELRAVIVEVEKPPAPVNVAGNRYRLSSSELWSCSYSLPIILRFPETEDLRIQFQRSGAGATRIRGQLIPVTAGQSCVTSAQAEVEFGGDYQQVAWRLPIEAVIRKLSALTGRAATRRLDFEHALALQTPQPAALLNILETLLRAIDTASPGSAKLVLPELENALIVSFLCTAQHTYRDVLEHPTSGAAPWQVRRAESYIEAHWDRPLAIEDLVLATGVSARSLFRAFRKSRGYSPLEFARQRRLQQARRLLESPHRLVSVTEVAVACGFENLSRFSKDFARAFGETPSAVRKRAVNRT